MRYRRASPGNRDGRMTVHHRRRDVGGWNPLLGEPDRKRGSSTLRSNLSKTREALGAEIQATLLQGDLDEETWERLEEALIMADVGAATTARVVADLEQEAAGGSISGGEALSERLAAMLAAIARTGEDRIDLRPTPTVEHGRQASTARQDTTIGKLAGICSRRLGLRSCSAPPTRFAPRPSSSSPDGAARGL